MIVISIIMTKLRVLLILIELLAVISFQRHYTQIRLSLKSLNLAPKSGSGFGSKEMPGISANNKKLSTLKQQVRILTENDACICGSGLSYKECCARIHSERLSPSTTIVQATNVSELVQLSSLVRARFSAYAIGLGNFIIDTSHNTQKEVVKYFGGTKDPKKSRKVW